MSNRTIVHVGLPKTANTTLKKHIFPIIGARPNWSFSAQLQKQMLNEIVYPYQFYGKRPDARFINNGRNIIISHEEFIGGNPGNWKNNLQLCKSFFGTDVEIVLTMRNEEDWLMSLYNQAAKEFAFNLRPQDFFLKRSEYDQKCTALGRFASFSQMFFSVDDFCFEKLLSDLKSYFKKVWVVKYEDLSDCNELAEIFEIDRVTKQKLRDAFELNRANKSARSNLIWQKVRNRPFDLPSDRSYRDIHLIGQIVSNREPIDYAAQRVCKSLVRLAKLCRSFRTPSSGIADLSELVAKQVSEKSK